MSDSIAPRIIAPKAIDAAARRLSLARLAAFTGALGLLLLVAFSVFFAWNERQREFRAAEREVRAAAFSLSVHASHLFQAADVVLRGSATLIGSRDWNDLAADRTLQAQIRGLARSLSYGTDVWLNDQTGELRLTSFAFPAPQSNASDRDVFKALARPTSNLSVGERILGKVTKEQSFLLARRLEGASGNFRGMVSVTANLNYFNQFWRQMPLPADTRVRLLRQEELDVLAQHPPAGPNAPFVNFDRGLLRSAIASDPVEGFLRQPSFEGDVPRLLAYRQVGELPVYVTVGVSSTSIRDAWLGNMLAFLPVEVAAILMLAGLTVAAFRQARNEGQSKASLEQAQLALHATNALLEERVERRTAELRDETARLDTLNQLGSALASELDPERLSRAVIEAGTQLVGAAYGALFERVAGNTLEPQTISDKDVWQLAALSGAPREAFTRFGLPRATNLFGPTFRAEGVIRSDDVLDDPRYGSMGGMPAGHLPVRSYMAVPVVSRSGEVLGALLFGHPAPNRFSEREEKLLVGFAGQTASALDNARLFAAMQREVVERARAEEELKESSEEIQRYAYIVSHDLRAPLVNVMGFTSELEAIKPEILAAGAKPENDPARHQAEADFDEALGFIKAAITKMDRLINAILKLSREGRRTFNPEPLDMPALLQSLADAQRHQADVKGAEVVIAPDLPPLVADRLGVEQVFGNLLDNALKYLSPDRPGRVEISGERAGPARVRFFVKDNGRGIAPQDHGRIFELFRRSGRQDVAGEGIGLAHVRAMVRSMGGVISVASELGAGTTFTVVLPAAPQALVTRQAR